ncbi:hypothetical protein JYT83_01255, partial [bacterium AH-315-F18]|nr:hypothetical protein [bacterium AH-315-F18]
TQGISRRLARLEKEVLAAYQATGATAAKAGLPKFTSLEETLLHLTALNAQGLDALKGGWKSLANNQPQAREQLLKFLAGTKEKRRTSTTVVYVIDTILKQVEASNPHVNFFRAEALFHADRADLAQVDVKACLKNPGAARAEPALKVKVHILAGKIERHFDRTETALRHFTLARAASLAGNPLPTLQLAATYLGLNDYQNTLTYLREAKQQVGDNHVTLHIKGGEVTLHEVEGLALHQEGRHDLAQVAFETAVKQQTDEAGKNRMQMYMAHAKLLDGRVDEATKLADPIIQKSPNNLNYQYLDGLLALAHRRNHAASNTALRLIRDFPDKGKGYLLLAQHQRTLRIWAAAESAADEAIERFKTQGHYQVSMEGHDAFELRLRMRIRQKKLDLAAQDLKDNKANLAALRWNVARAALFTARSDWAQAITALKSALDGGYAYRYVAADPLLAALRKRPEFQSLKPAGAR